MKTASELLSYTPNYARKNGNLDKWAVRHITALMAPSHRAATGQLLEKPLVLMLKGWLEYADAHYLAYKSPIGEDGVLGAEWEVVGKALLGLLNGDLGHLDGGTLDHIIRQALEQNGFNPDA